MWCPNDTFYYVFKSEFVTLVRLKSPVGKEIPASQVVVRLELAQVEVGGFRGFVLPTGEIRPSAEEAWEVARTLFDFVIGAGDHARVLHFYKHHNLTSFLSLSLFFFLVDGKTSASNLV